MLKEGRWVKPGQRGSPASLASTPCRLTSFGISPQPTAHRRPDIDTQGIGALLFRSHIQYRTTDRPEARTQTGGGLSGNTRRTPPRHTPLTPGPDWA